MLDHYSIIYTMIDARSFIELLTKKKKNDNRSKKPLPENVVILKGHDSKRFSVTFLEFRRPTFLNTSRTDKNYFAGLLIFSRRFITGFNLKKKVFCLIFIVSFSFTIKRLERHTPTI